VPEERGGERRFAGPVGAHEGVDLAGADLEVDAFEDLGAVDRDVQVDDLEEGGVAWRVSGHG